MYNAFDCNPSFEVRGIVLNISKAFDKEWHGGLICKLKRNGINGDLLRLIESFLSDRYDIVVVNGQTSTLNKIKIGVTQASILGPFFFLIYISDLPFELRCSAKLCWWHISIFCCWECQSNHCKSKKRSWKYKQMGTIVEDVL